MSSLMLRSIACVVGLIFLSTAAPAEAAKARKHKRVAAAHITGRAQTVYRGTNLFPAGPIYNGLDNLGDDPDPFIRSQLQRDLGARYGGEN